jgi:hypothetical protein
MFQGLGFDDLGSRLRQRPSEAADLHVKTASSNNA